MKRYTRRKASRKGAKRSKYMPDVYVNVNIPSSYGMQCAPQQVPVVQEDQGGVPRIPAHQDNPPPPAAGADTDVVSNKKEVDEGWAGDELVKDIGEGFEDVGGKWLRAAGVSEETIAKAKKHWSEMGPQAKAWAKRNLDAFLALFGVNIRDKRKGVDHGDDEKHGGVDDEVDVDPSYFTPKKPKLGTTGPRQVPLQPGKEQGVPPLQSEGDPKPSRQLFPPDDDMEDDSSLVSNESAVQRDARWARLARSKFRHSKQLEDTYAFNRPWKFRMFD